MDGLQQIAGLSDERLIDALARLAASERRAIALLVAALAEFDVRRLYLGLGYSSLFSYCTGALRLSEQATFNRIEAARLSKRLPVILDCIADGTLSLTAARLLAPHLTDDNHREVIGQARHKKTREIEQLVARLRPLPAVPTVIRRLPDKSPAHTPSSNQPQPMSTEPASTHGGHSLLTAESPARVAAPVPPRPRVTPLSEALYRVQVTISKEAHDLLREAQQLLRHSIPNGDAAAIVERALSTFVIQLRRTKFGESSRPRDAGAVAKGRHIPASVRRAVAARDGHRCAFVSADGTRCTETGFLEFHHVMPYARGGKTVTANIELRCRAHNAHEAELEFGPYARG